MLSARSVTAVGVWATAGVVGTILWLYATPELERRFLPVLTDQSVEVVERSPGRVCWR